MGIARSIFSRGSSPTTYKSTDNAQNEQIERYRAEANSHRQHYHEYSKQAKQAYNKRRGGEAHSLSQQAHEHKDQMEEANSKAVQLLISRQQSSIDNGEVDLHGFYVNESIDFLKSVLESKAKDDDGNKELTVITGKGLHSKGGVAKIRPAVIGYLKKHGYVYKLSPGIVTVDVTSGTPEKRRRHPGCCVIS